MTHDISTHRYTKQQDLEKEFLNNILTRKIAEKFSYIGERQINSWIALYNSPEYEYYRNSKKLLENKVQEFTSTHSGDVNVIALGMGSVDAYKEKLIANSLLEKNRTSLFLMDTSKEILNRAIKHIEGDILKELFIADVMNSEHIQKISQHIRKNHHPTHFFTLLGNTMGNYRQTIMLNNIRTAMAPGDKILIDVDGREDVSIEEQPEKVMELIERYKQPIYIQKSMATLSETGIDENDGEIHVEFNKDTWFPDVSAIEHFFSFHNHKMILYKGEDFRFTKGERILVHHSKKYTLNFLETAITSYGMHIIKYAKGDNGKCHQLLCELA